MRNGNIPLIHSFLFLLFSSYPTYEEWKPKRLKETGTFGFHCSYPTYEEWKLFHIWSIAGPEYRSYPTYEEWKHSSLFASISFTSSVLILPMRNGNLKK